MPDLIPADRYPAVGNPVVDLEEADLVPVPPCNCEQIFNLDFLNENGNTPIRACLTATLGVKRSQKTIPLPASSHFVCCIAYKIPWNPDLLISKGRKQKYDCYISLL